MITSRWRKVIADLLSSKVRTLLVVFSIAVGTFAAGLVSSTTIIVNQDLNSDYQPSNPQSGQLFTAPFGEDLLAAARRVPGVEYTAGVSGVSVKVEGAGGVWRDLYLSMVAKPDEMQINRLRSVDNNPLPRLKENEILIDQSALGIFPVKPGDYIQVELQNKQRRTLRVAGVVHDPTAISSLFSNLIYGYVNPQTLENLSGFSEYSALIFTVKENKTDEAHVKEVAAAIAEKIERSGREVYFTLVSEPGKHPLSTILNTVMLLLGGLGGLVIFLGTSLVINTMNAIISQHTRQIGMMKSIGARTRQIVGMYAALVLGFGTLALAISVPLSALGSYGSAYLLSTMLNYVPGPFRIPLPTLLLQIVVALLVPLVTSILPVIKGSRMTVREALTNYGLTSTNYQSGKLDRFLEKVWVFSRPLLISLRNTFRRKGRLALTLTTLTLAGAIFIAVFNLRSSFNITIENTLGYFLSDINISLDRARRVVEMEPLLRSIPGVADVEPWNFRIGQLLSADKQTATEIIFIAPPSNTQLLEPVVTTGRWLTPQDENAVVVGNHLLEQRPEIKVGDELVVRLNERETKWRVVGFFQLAGNVMPPPIYVNSEYLNRLLNEEGLGYEYHLKTVSSDTLTISKIADQLTQLLDQRGIGYGQIVTGSEVRRQNAVITDVLVNFLMSMAILIAIVGGLGLMGAMSINVLERTREIGVMRSIGAKNRAIFLIVIVEGMFIGTISWILGALLAIPISYLMDIGVGIAFVRLPLQFSFSGSGLLLWWMIVLILSILASWLPARTAMHLTVRDVLNYE